MVLAVAFVGLLVGGFLNSFSYRIEKSKNLFAPIHCRHCNTQLVWIDIVPVLSWIYFRAKCRYCGGYLSFIYPFVELSAMLYCLLLYTQVSFGMNMILLFLLGFTTMAMSLVDIRAYRLPNNLIVMLGLLGMVWCFSDPTQAFIDATILAFIGVGLKYGFEKFLRTPSLGLGDIKLLAIAGLWVQTFDIPLFLVLSGFFGIIMGLIWESRRKSRVFPFAPALSLALLVTVWWRVLQ